MNLLSLYLFEAWKKLYDTFGFCCEWISWESVTVYTTCLPHLLLHAHQQAYLSTGSWRRLADGAAQDWLCQDKRRLRHLWFTGYSPKVPARSSPRSHLERLKSIVQSLNIFLHLLSGWNPAHSFRSIRDRQSWWREKIQVETKTNIISSRELQEMDFTYSTSTLYGMISDSGNLMSELWRTEVGMLLVWDVWESVLLKALL